MRPILLALLLIVGSTLRLDAQVINQTVGQGNTAIGNQSPIYVGGQGGGGGPGTCSNALDFSQACNSQYLVVVP